MGIYTYREIQRKAREHLRDLLALESGLTPWEVEFIDDMADLDTLEPGQIEKIYEIFDERC